MSAGEKKKFVMKHVFTDVMNMKPNKSYYGEEENHFSVPWRLQIEKIVQNAQTTFRIILGCLASFGNDKWSITADVEWKFLKETGEEPFLRRARFFSQKAYMYTIWNLKTPNLNGILIDGTLTLECHEKVCNFDEPANEFSDIVLKVDDQKFYVMKKYLAHHSSYFKSLFMGNFSESDKSEIELKDINKWDFQNFLEVIYGEATIDEDTVSGILHLADMYDAKTAIRRCEEFLVKNSK